MTAKKQRKPRPTRKQIADAATAAHERSEAAARLEHDDLDYQRYDEPRDRRNSRLGAFISLAIIATFLAVSGWLYWHAH